MFISASPLFNPLKIAIIGIRIEIRFRLKNNVKTKPTLQLHLSRLLAAKANPNINAAKAMFIAGAVKKRARLIANSVGAGTSTLKSANDAATAGTPKSNDA